MNPSQDEQPEPADDARTQRIVVVSQDGMGVADSSGDKESSNPADLVEQPGKVMRIGSMVKQLLEEVRNAPLDEAGRTRLAEIHRRSLSELEQGLAPELIDELERITLPFSDHAPGDAELRIAQSQLDDWLERLSYGIQAELFALQMAAQQRLLNIADLAAASARCRATNDGQDRGPGQGLDPCMPAPEGIGQSYESV